MNLSDWLPPPRVEPPALDLLAELSPTQEGTATAADGTVLAYQVFGAGPAFVMGNGIGVLYPGLVRQIRHYMKRFRVITWDYRGHGNSRLAHPDAAVDMATHARDVLAILDALGEPSTVYLGWSMGVQVGLELLRVAPERVRAFVALFGTFGQPFRHTAPPPVGQAVELFWQGLLHVPEVLAATARLGTLMPNLSLPLLTLIRFITPTTSPEVFLSNMRNVADADHRTYIRTMVALAHHDARDVLASITAPTLVIGGEYDYLTPPKLSEQLAAAIPGAEGHVLKGSSHYGLIEDGQPVNDLIDAFLERRLQG